MSRPTEMLHDELIVCVAHARDRVSTLTKPQRHLWTVAYFSGASTTPALGQRWLGPSPTLGGLRLWEKGLTPALAMSGTTAPDRPICIGIRATQAGAPL